MTKPMLLACDLDRTIVPNGPEPLSVGATDFFSEFVDRDEVILAYISGRNLRLIKEAIGTHNLPMPDVAVGDVGTSMYFKKDDYLLHTGWDDEIGKDWGDTKTSEILNIVEELTSLERQEGEHQNAHKASFYASLECDEKRVKNVLSERFEKEGIDAAITHSVDQQKGISLFDILPKSATKKHALEYLAHVLDIPDERVVYAGDSGNDIEPLTSGYQAVVVKNARKEIKEKVQSIAAEKGIEEKVYFAEGGFRGMNGNYVGGVLEGLHHFGFFQ